jgi:hypothetical protein
MFLFPLESKNKFCRFAFSKRIKRMKINKIIYYTSTGLLTLMMLLSLGLYLFNNEEIQQVFRSLSFPTYLIYPLGTANFLGVMALWFIRSRSIKTCTYAGFLFSFVLGFFPHYMISDGG